MKQSDLIKLGFKKASIPELDLPTDPFYYERSFGQLTFLSGSNDEAEIDGSWYVTTPCQSLKFRSYTELKSVIDIFARNQVSEIIQ
mgnify:CR=1 FL=1|tara:strand:+ start:69 stop:326 length:258 start_codon:yes stop_codon:yes gene_type:complete